MKKQPECEKKSGSNQHDKDNGPPQEHGEYDMKIYTKTGDDGSTGLLGNVRVGKESHRIEAYGTVDETNAALGLILAHLPAAAQAAHAWLNDIQSDLLIIGSLLATPPNDPKKRTDLPAARTQALENHIDQMEAALQPLKNFILPQGAPCARFSHLARAISRRAERRVVSLARDERVDKGCDCLFKPAVGFSFRFGALDQYARRRPGNHLDLFPRRRG